MENYTIVSCVSVFITALIAVIISYNMDSKSDRKYNELQKDYDVLDNNYNELDKDYKDLEESMIIYTTEQSKKIEDLQSALLYGRNWHEENKILLNHYAERAKIFHDVVAWFIDSVNKNKTSRAITYMKCLKAIADAQKIDLQNQMPDDKPNKATEYLFSLNEAPGKPL
jgi:ABC-type Na+ efflux pump permease subunit